MAEVVGVVSSAITFATLALQVGKSVQNLKDYWDSMRDAPDDLKWLVRQIEVFGSIINDIDADLSQNPVALAIKNSQHASQSLRFCEEAVKALNLLCKDLLQDVDSSSRLRRTYQAAKIVLRQRKIEKHISRLHDVVHLLMLSQQCYTRALIQVQPGLIVEIIAQREVISSCADASISSVAPHGISKPKKHRRDHQNSDYVWFLRGPDWLTSRVLEISGMKTPGGWDWRLLTYAEVPWSGEVDYYLKEGKIKNLQELFASGNLSPLVRMQGSGRSLLHYAIGVDRNEHVVEFLLEQGVDPSIKGGLGMLKTPLQLLLEYGRMVASNKAYPLLPFLRPLLRHSQDLIYDNAQETVEGILSEFHGTPEEFIFLQQHCCPMFYQMPRWARITVAAQIILDAPIADCTEEASNAPDLIRTILGQDMSEARDLQATCTLPFASKETTLMHCVATKLGTYRAYLQMSSRKNLNIGKRHQRFSRPAIDHCHAKLQATCEAWNSLFTDFLRVGVDIHQVVDARTLLSAFLEGYLASQVFRWEFERIPWLEKEEVQVGIRALLKDMKAAGLGLETFGASEWCIWNKKGIRRDFNGGLQRVTGITYGPRPEDWYIWLSEPSDTFVGDFWAFVARPAEIMPGAWPGE